MRYLLLLCVALVISACNDKPIKVEHESITVDTDSLNRLSADSIAEQYEAFKLSSNAKKLSFSYDSIIPNNTVAFNGIIKDIDRSSGDSLTLTLFQFVPRGKSFLAKVGITDSVASIISQSLNDSTKRDKGQFIIEVSNKKLHSIPLSIHQENINMAMNAFHNVILIDGRLKAFYLYRK